MSKTDNYYVYTHIDPNNNGIFYVGYGKGSRAKDKENRNSKWKDKVKQLNGQYKIGYINKNLSKLEALDLEQQSIHRIKKEGEGGTLVNILDGGINEIYSPRMPLPPIPEFFNHSDYFFEYGNFLKEVGDDKQAEHYYNKSKEIKRQVLEGKHPLGYLNPFDDFNYFLNSRGAPNILDEQRQLEIGEEKALKNLFDFTNSLSPLSKVDEEQMISEIRIEIDKFSDRLYRLSNTINNDAYDLEMTVCDAIGYDLIDEEEEDKLWTLPLMIYLKGKGDHRNFVSANYEIILDLEFELEECKGDHNELILLSKDVIKFYKNLLNNYFPSKKRKSAF